MININQYFKKNWKDNLNQNYVFGDFVISLYWSLFTSLKIKEINPNKIYTKLTYEILKTLDDKSCSMILKKYLKNEKDELLIKILSNIFHTNENPLMLIFKIRNLLNIDKDNNQNCYWPLFEEILNSNEIKYLILKNIKLITNKNTNIKCWWE